MKVGYQAAGPRSGWPVLARYSGEHTRQIALPLGGIGTGTVSLGGRGDLRDWEIVNRAAKGFVPDNAFAVLRCSRPGGEAVTRVLESALRPPFEGPHGHPGPLAGLPRFRSGDFAAAYPLGQVALSDPGVPLTVRIEAFNPFVPCDVEASSVPVAVLRYVLDNPGAEDVAASVCLSLANFVGTDGCFGAPSRNLNSPRVAPGVSGLLMSSEGVAADSEQHGTIAVAVLTQDGDDVTHRTAWAEHSWGNSLLDFWDDFSGDGRLDERPRGKSDSPTGSVACATTVPAGGSRSVTFLLGWHFPNRRTWSTMPHRQPQPKHRPEGPDGIVGNHYATRYQDAWQVVEDTAARLAELEAETVGFVEAFASSDLPETVKEAALANLSTLRTQTCFRTADGHFFGWEGLDEHGGSCYGSCTHVWNYEHATAHLFGELSRSMRDVEFTHATRADGHMSFRVDLPLDHATDWGVAAADGQLGCLMQLHRDWQLSGDDGMLRRLWPKARAALEFCWIENGWDGDADGVMEGCQHNTMDVEYYGPNPQMQFWYVGALRASAVLAAHLGEDEFASRCSALADRGSAFLDTHLFNGEYYEHRIDPLPAKVADGIRCDEPTDPPGTPVPELQLGPGCLVDQTVGQLTAHVAGLGHLAAPQNVRSALVSVHRYNRVDGMHDHVNHMRTYALNDESALLMATYPRGGRPQLPFPYFAETMTGFEYTAAAHMLYEGLTEEGLQCLADIRHRYDGLRRNPFDEAECGHHYARSLASWTPVLALTGFGYSALTGTLAFRAPDRAVTWFWSTGEAWGTVALAPQDGAVDVRIEVRGGTVRLSGIRVGEAHTALPAAIEARRGTRVSTRVGG
ncbi:non-lysosomal glucosylceramidase [Streptomyces beijiangensis]